MKNRRLKLQARDLETGEPCEVWIDPRKLKGFLLDALAPTELRITTPQFTRTPGTPTPGCAPETPEAWQELRTMSRAALEESLQEKIIDMARHLRNEGTRK